MLWGITLAVEGIEQIIEIGWKKVVNHMFKVVLEAWDNKNIFERIETVKHSLNNGSSNEENREVDRNLWLNKNEDKEWYKEDGMFIVYSYTQRWTHALR